MTQIQIDMWIKLAEEAVLNGNDSVAAYIMGYIERVTPRVSSVLVGEVSDVE